MPILQLLSFHIHPSNGGCTLRPQCPRSKFSALDVFPTYPLTFHTPAHSFALTQNSTLCFNGLRTLCEKHPRGWGTPLRRIGPARETVAAEFVSSLSPYFITSLLPYVQRRRRPSRSDGAAAKRAHRLQERRPFDGKFNSRAAVAAPPSRR
jgi:hypothetical protein